MKTYHLTLYNRSMISKLKAKENVLKLVLKNFVNDKSIPDVTSAKIKDINDSGIIMEVDESGDSWHKKFGKMLANEYLMREYCDQNNPSRLFKWKPYKEVVPLKHDFSNIKINL